MHPVAIVGGGPTGLVASILLTLRGIPHVLFERYPSTSIHPKACGLNHRTIEIFRKIGVEKEIERHRAPKDIVGRTAWYTGFGPGGKEIVSRDSWGGGIFKREYDSVSPSSYSVLPQIRLEPILQRRALELNSEAIHYNTDVTKVEEKDDHVSITIQRQSQSEPVQLKASYCIGADGGRSMTDDLGIGYEGERDVLDMVSAHVRAPISLHHPDIRNFITWFINPTLGGSTKSGYLYHLGPYPMSSENEEWLFCCGLNPNDPKKFDEDSMLDRMRKTVNLPNLPVKLLSTSHWYVNAICANQYRSQPANRKGRVFLVGDAAHRIPPWGALGLNTGVQDVYNLIWKLSLAITNKDSSAFNPLLDTYDEERRPIGQRVRTTSLHNLRSHSAVMDKAIGLDPDRKAEENSESMDTFFNPTDDNGGFKQVEAVNRAQKALDNEFHALGAEIGWFYPTLDTEGEGAKTRHDGQVDEQGKFDVLSYHPSTIPGHHLPHAWIERWGQKVSTRDLVSYDSFALFTAEPQLWRDATLDTADTVDVIGIAGKINGTRDSRLWRNIDGQWEKYCGVGRTGAVLVRPDGIVVWRAKDFDRKKHGGREWFSSLIRRCLKIEDKQAVQNANESPGARPLKVIDPARTNTVSPSVAG